ncbi:MAG: hypothetical protein PVI76_13140 [Desulfobacterales bacterium]
MKLEAAGNAVAGVQDEATPARGHRPLDVNKVVVYGFLPNTQRNGQPARIHGRFFKQCDYLLSQCFLGHANRTVFC